MMFHAKYFLLSAFAQESKKLPFPEILLAAYLQDSQPKCDILSYFVPQGQRNPCEWDQSRAGVKKFFNPLVWPPKCSLPCYWMFQDGYFYLLRRYLETLYPGCQATEVFCNLLMQYFLQINFLKSLNLLMQHFFQIYLQLIRKLLDLRHLNESHVKVINIKYIKKYNI